MNTQKRITKHPLQSKKLSATTNSTPLKSRFTKGFLQALSKINNKSRSGTLSVSDPRNPREIFQRYKAIKVAAYKSLAFAVGSKRAWSRALLRSIRKKRNPRSTLKRKMRVSKGSVQSMRRKRTGDHDGDDQVKALSKLVPGGEGMDLCCLLDEAANYIECLNVQVQVMRNVVDIFS